MPQRSSLSLWLLLAAALAAQHGVHAFSGRAGTSILGPSRSTTHVLPHAAASTVFEGEPTERARTAIDHRQVIRQFAVTNLEGQQVYFDDLIGPPPPLGDNENEQQQTSIVVFLRSLG